MTMKGRHGGRLRPAIVVLGAVMPIIAAVPAHASGGRAGSDIQLAYDPPQLSADGSHLSWHWTLPNMGTDAAAHVTPVQRLNAPPPGGTATPPGEIAPKVIRCRWESVPAGGMQEGSIDSPLPTGGGGLVRLSGRITWVQATWSTSEQLPAEPPEAQPEMIRPAVGQPDQAPVTGSG